MIRVRWYGPTLILILTTLIVLIAGPELVRRIEYAQVSEHIRLVRDSLTSNPSLAELSDAFRRVGTVVEPSVVHIEVYSRRQVRRNRLPDQFFEHWFFRPNPRPQEEPRGRDRDNYEQYDRPQHSGDGSGWVYDEQGHIVTNFHVIKEADKIMVRFHDGAERQATVQGTDDKTDTAVLKVEGGDLHPATRAKERVEQGDIVFAFGSPFRFKFSMSQGIVSGIGRQLGILLEHGGFESFIQTDAAINPGNSGGPLTNIRGEVVGMNTAIASRTGGYSGLGFAIPIDMVEKVVQQIVEKGHVDRGYLGIVIDPLTKKMARTFGYDGEGVLVRFPMEGTPAEKEGIRNGDIIVSVDGEPVSHPDELRDLIAAMPPGTNVDVEIFRNGKSNHYNIKLATLPAKRADFRTGHPVVPDEDADNQMLKKIGLESVATFTEEAAERGRLEFTPGVLVRSVRPGSAAAEARIGGGQVITHVMDVAVKSVNELVDELATHDLDKGVRITIVKEGLPRFELLEMLEAD